MPFRKRFYLIQTLLLFALVSTIFLFFVFNAAETAATRLNIFLVLFIIATIITASLMLYRTHISNRNLYNQTISINQDLARIREKEKLMNRYMNIAAHDIRNPLHIILSSSEALRQMEEQLNDDRREFYSFIEHAGERITDMLTHMLDIQKMEEGGVRVHLQEFRVHEILDSLVYSYRHLAEKKGISLQLVDEIRNQRFRIDKSIFLQTADNLMSNAIKYSHPGGEVIVRLESDDGHLMLIVQDQGPGIKPEEMDRLFNRFAKLSSRPTGNEISTGLGLSIVKEQMDAAGGRIWCESEPGHGAKFIAEFTQYEDAN